MESRAATFGYSGDAQLFFPSPQSAIVHRPSALTGLQESLIGYSVGADSRHSPWKLPVYDHRKPNALGSSQPGGCNSVVRHALIRDLEPASGSQVHVSVVHAARSAKAKIQAYKEVCVSFSFNDAAA